MSESAVLALIREQSTSRDESENSSSQRGAVQREYNGILGLHARLISRVNTDCCKISVNMTKGTSPMLSFSSVKAVSPD